MTEVEDYIGEGYILPLKVFSSLLRERAGVSRNPATIRRDIIALLPAIKEVVERDAEGGSD